jgi:hypothetical protein
MGARLLIAAGAAASDSDSLPVGIRMLIDAADEITVVASRSDHASSGGVEGGECHDRLDVTGCHRTPSRPRSYCAWALSRAATTSR